MKTAIITVLSIFAIIIAAVMGFRWAVTVDHKWYRGGGQHKGYVTAVDCNPGGLVSKHYCTVYFKTALDSSQEDEYSVELNSPILDDLRKAQDDKSNILIKYDRITFRGWHYDGSSDFITSIKGQ